MPRAADQPSVYDKHEISIDNHLLKPVGCDGGTKLGVPNDPDKVIISRVQQVLDDKC